jgi:hypothetical protein
VASAGRAYPYIATFTIRSRSMPMLKALRTRASSNGGRRVFA